MLVRACEIAQARHAAVCAAVTAIARFATASAVGSATDGQPGLGEA
jgi:hypothetical protein